MTELSIDSRILEIEFRVVSYDRLKPAVNYAMNRAL